MPTRPTDLELLAQSDELRPDPRTRRIGLLLIIASALAVYLPLALWLL